MNARFLPSKWVEIHIIYERELLKNGSCSTRRLSVLSSVSLSSAFKFITSYNSGLDIPPIKKRGHGKSGVGSLLGFKMKHHAFIFELYLKNPTLPLIGYVDELESKFSLFTSVSTITRWFATMGPFKGNLRVTGSFPPGRDSPVTADLFCRYIEFMTHIESHRRVVFADEKPMKELMLFKKIRRNIVDGSTPRHRHNVNSRNRYNILCAVTIKGSGIRPVEYVILEECTNSQLFLEFVKMLLQKGTLQRGDIFVVDNCTIHTKGDNIAIQETLFRNYQILMIPLPPYHPDLNPTELVFNTLLQRLSSERARYNLLFATDFLDAIHIAMSNFDITDVIAYYKHCGYFKDE